MGNNDICLKTIRSKPELNKAIKRYSVDSYDDFVDAIHDGIIGAIQYIEKNPQLRQNDNEDRLTIEIIGFLVAKGFDASHDTQTGGHVDIYIKKDNKFFWCAEAKIHSDYPYLMKGFNQLTTRYANGAPNGNKGGFLIYIKNANANNVISKWKEHLSSSRKDITLTNNKNPCRGTLSFTSEHTHNASGLTYHVCHFGIVLHFSPQDRVNDIKINNKIEGMQS